MGGKKWKRQAGRDPLKLCTAMCRCTYYHNVQVVRGLNLGGGGEREVRAARDVRS